MDLYKEYLSTNLKDYYDINFDLYISKVLMFVFLGFVILNIFLSYRKASAMYLLKELISNNAVGEEGAIKDTELGMSKFSLLCALSYKKISKFFTTTKVKEFIESEEENGKKKKKQKITLIYIKKRRYDDALLMSEATSPSVVKFILFFLMMICIFVCLMFVIPEILITIGKIVNKK